MAADLKTLIETVAKALADVKRVAGTNQNLMPSLLEAVQVHCTVGEIMNTLAEVFGRCDAAAQW